jgi:hypothetical protein
VVGVKADLQKGMGKNSRRRSFYKRGELKIIVMQRSIWQALLLQGIIEKYSSSF